MKKYITIVIVLLALAAGYLWMLPTDKKVSEDFPEQFSQEQLVTKARKGSFEGVGNSYAFGDVLIVESETEYLIRFEREFDVDSGSNLKIVFATDGEYKKGLEIADLKGNRGSQNYIIQKDVDLGQYNEIWVLSGLFSKGVAKADLAGVLK